ncbi:hypothetical protein [Saccharopolyspora phatthalungensis]|uniref:Uncharacterized protein n=1 Tax=Saccharopolyspora phatthalungensis TaxID=664693 RepID=A0A840QHX4_9PSEU|nr:hypothetical protein [Saccharopolyspora phatthalungensis]MBB5156913.1 hypothetical protein [Saccharopolyspora phatthalungensis]
MVGRLGAPQGRGITTQRIQIASVEIVFLIDDWFGVAVANRLAEAPPTGSRIENFGIRVHRVD